MSHNLRIEHAPNFTSITFPDGTPVKGVTAADVHFEPRKPATVDVRILCPSVNTSAEARFLVVDPRDGLFKRVRSIEFADGTRFDA